MRCRVSILAAKELVGVAFDEADRCCRKPDLERIEVLEERTKFLVYASMRLVSDDQVEEADIEIFVALHHRRVGSQIDAFVAVA